MSMLESAHKIAISIETEYLVEESDDINQQHVFLYTINIVNEGTMATRLLGRHWFITDSDGNTKEVKGEGVVGEQPHLKPGENFQYTSYAIINTPIGSMQGTYQMISEDGQFFNAEIPSFLLANPLLIN
jgi:ApaG protein